MKQSAPSVRKQLRWLLSGRTNRTHYLKWELDQTNEWSVRYFFWFDNKKEYNGKFVLKNHQTKDYIELTREQAIEYIETFAKTGPKEIHGCRLQGNGYKKSIFQH